MKKNIFKLIPLRIHFGILFILALAACVTSGMFWTNSQAQELLSEKILEDSSSSSYDLNTAFSKIIIKAQKKGTVPIIVGFRADFTPEGYLSNQLKENQRNEIKQHRNSLLQKLEEFKPENIKQFETTPYLAVTVNVKTLEFLRTLPEITFIREDEFLAPTLAESTVVVHAPQAWAAGYSGAGQVVAILDTGVDKNHAFLSGKVISEACYSTNSATTASFCPGGASNSTASNSALNCSASGCEHGTHVAGIVAGRLASGGVQGVARDANLVAIQVFSRKTANNETTAVFSDVRLGLQRVLLLKQSGMNIAAANLSLGTPAVFTSTLACDSQFSDVKADIDNLRSVGVATVIASGNGDDNGNGYTNAISSPACISSAISVGSTGYYSTTDNDVSSYSNSSSFLNLLAPGYHIYSSIPGTYGEISGTSQATPHVAGAWAILKQRAPNATVTQVLDALRTTGQPITDYRNGIVKPRILIDAALQALGGGNCTYAVSPASSSIFAATSGNGSFSITTTSGCTWTAVSNASWISITSGSSGNGNGTVNYAVTANTSTSSRTGTITVSGQVYTITQTGIGSGCTYAINPTSASIAASDGNSSTAVTTTTGCAWTAVSNASWISVTAGASGSGNGTVSYSVQANTTGAARSGTITIAGQAFTVSQAAGGSGGGCSITPIGFGQTINSSLANCIFTGTTRYVDPYSFNGTAGQQIAVSMNSAGFDTYLYLRNSSNQILYEDDDGGGSTNSRIPTGSGLFTLPATGTYTIQATSYYSGVTGAYSLTLTQGSGGIRNRKTAGVFRPSNGITYMRNSNTGGIADISMIYGVAGDQSFAGDWNGDSVNSIGIYRNGVFYLRNSNTTGPADIVFAFGAPGDQPIAGDWNRDGVDTIGLYRPSTGVFMLRNSNSAGAPDSVFVLGNPGDVAIAGDWNGDGTTTTGVFRPSNGIIYLKNTNVSGNADVYLVYGVAGDKPLAGDWDGDGFDSVGIYRNGLFYLRNSNTQGNADLVFALGNPGDEPIAGDWDGIP